MGRSFTIVVSNRDIFQGVVPRRKAGRKKRSAKKPATIDKSINPPKFWFMSNSEVRKIVKPVNIMSDSRKHGFPSMRSAVSRAFSFPRSWRRRERT